MLEVLDRHAPIITIQPRKKGATKPWIKGDTLTRIRLKQAAKIRKEYSPSQENVTRYYQLKKECDKITVKAKQDFYHLKISENSENPRKIWKIMGDLAPALLPQKNTVNDEELTAEDFATYFASIGGEANNSPSTEEYLSQRSSNLSFQIKDSTEADIMRIVNHMALNKAAGSDGIPMKAIKLGLNYLCKPLTKLVNKFIKLGLPMELKSAIVTPIYKKGKSNLTSNYRPISILPSTSKIIDLSQTN